MSEFSKKMARWSELHYEASQPIQKSDHNPWFDLQLELFTFWPEIRAEIERLTAEVAAAKVALQTHPCILEDGNFDHEWKFVDDSFDHEYGTQIEQYYECKHCKATQDYEGDDE